MAADTVSPLKIAIFTTHSREPKVSQEEQRCRAAAAALADYVTITGVFGVGGIDNLLEAIQAGKVDVVVYDAASGGARNPVRVNGVRMVFEDYYGVQLHCAGQTSQPLVPFAFITIAAAVLNAEPPDPASDAAQLYGYYRNGSPFVLDAAKAEAVRQRFQAYLNGSDDPPPAAST